MAGADPMDPRTATDPMLQEFLKSAVRVVSGQRGLIMTPVPGTPDMEVRAAVGLEPGTDLSTVWSSGLISQTILRKVVEEKQALLTHNAMQDPRFKETTSVVISGLRSVIAVPIVVGLNQLWGVLYVDNPVTAGAFKAPNLNQLKEYTARLSTSL